MTAIVGVQRMMMELGRIRLGGEKTSNAPGRKLTHFRLTSASRQLLEAAAELYGGEVAEWQGAPDEGYFQLYTETSTLDIILPPVFSDQDGSPTLPYSQAYEIYKGPERVRCCNGIIESYSGKPCMCDPENRECELRTRLNVMLPKVPGLGVWLLQSKGWNAAKILPGTLDLLMLAAAEQSFIPAILRLEQRSKKKGGTTFRFAVPVIDLPEMRLEDHLALNGSGGGLVNGPLPRPTEKPALPPAPEPVAAKFENDDLPEFGELPALPKTSAPLQGPPPEPAAGADAPPAITAAQKKKLNVLVGQLRESGHLSTENVYNAVAKLREQPVAELVGDTGGWDGTELHWAPLRDLLTKAEAVDLIDRLEKLEQHAKAGAAA